MLDHGTRKVSQSAQEYHGKQLLHHDMIGEKCPGTPRARSKRACNQDTPPMDGHLADAKLQQLAQRQGWTRCPSCGYVVWKMVRLYTFSTITFTCLMHHDSFV